jgi:hypothetical protein
VTARLYDLAGVEVEHLIAADGWKPLVKLRAISDEAVLFGQIDPAHARRIAEHLTECAARAEYESDFIQGALAAGLEMDVIAMVTSLVRAGEEMRHEGGGG